MPIISSILITVFSESTSDSNERTRLLNRTSCSFGVIILIHDGLPWGVDLQGNIRQQCGPQSHISTILGCPDSWSIVLWFLTSFMALPAQSSHHERETARISPRIHEFKEGSLISPAVLFDLTKMTSWKSGLGTTYPYKRLWRSEFTITRILARVRLLDLNTTLTSNNIGASPPAMSAMNNYPVSFTIYLSDLVLNSI